MQAPNFELPDANNNKIKLSDYKGKNVVLYFYPKDNTPGCTVEAIDFSKLKKEFEKQNTVIIGISKDTCKSHQKFIDDQELTITLLSDEDHKIQEKYNVWGKKKFMGKEFMGTIRTTFLIDKTGKIIKKWENVKVQDHAKEVLTIIENI